MHRFNELDPPRRQGLLIVFLCSLILLGSDLAVAQMANDVRWANDLVKNSQAKTDVERAKVLAQVRDRLKPYRTSDPEVRAVADILERQADWLSIGPLSVVEDIGKAMAVTGQTERARLLKQIRADLLDRTSHLIVSAVNRKMTAEDAQKIINFARSFSQALDDLADPSILGGKTSSITRALARLNGIANLALSVEDPEAKRILSGLRGTIATWSPKLRHHDAGMTNPIATFDVPSQVLGAVLDTTKKGWDQSTNFLDDTSRAIAGDAAALDRLPQHAAMIGQTLSRENYGRAMLGALSDSIVNKFPFVRTLAGWFQPSPSEGAIAWLIGKWKFFNISNASDPDYMLIEFQMESTGVAGYIRKLNSAAAAAGYKLGEPVYRYYVDLPKPNASYYYPEADGECLYTDRDTGKQRWIKQSISLRDKYQGLETQYSCAFHFSGAAFFRSEKLN